MRDGAGELLADGQAVLALIRLCVCRERARLLGPCVLPFFAPGNMLYGLSSERHQPHYYVH